MNHTAALSALARRHRHLRTNILLTLFDLSDGEFDTATEEKLLLRHVAHRKIPEAEVLDALRALAVAGHVVRTQLKLVIMLDEKGLVAETQPARDIITLTYSGLAVVEALLDSTGITDPDVALTRQTDEAVPE